MREVELRTVAWNVRKRLQDADLSGAHPCFASFPTGACGATADILATVLERRFGVKPVWVSAEFGEGETWRSHAWLEVDGYTVDITADQFGEAAVVVARHSDWHQSLLINSRSHFPMEQRNWGEVGNTVWHLVSDLAGPASPEQPIATE